MISDFRGSCFQIFCLFFTFRSRCLFTFYVYFHFSLQPNSRLYVVKHLFPFKYQFALKLCLIKTEEKSSPFPVCWLGREWEWENSKNPQVEKQIVGKYSENFSSSALFMEVERKEKKTLLAKENCFIKFSPPFKHFTK